MRSAGCPRFFAPGVESGQSDTPAALRHSEWNRSVLQFKFYYLALGATEPLAVYNPSWIHRAAKSKSLRTAMKW